ncbi:thymine dioxygenase [Coccidioides immitis RMSCC 3703]|uniref:Thymine dioxygenase n=1 Tax=Coccidioides immitis RMSCC 3703 TaxID=454286 RepID=A0A0J8R279_COCIT|nr:thymine dioxygenase [Coccidioides immitis RMSCC 3703]
MANPSRYSPLTKLPIQLPIIDISNTRPETGKAMIDAATKYGFLYVDSVTSDFSDEDVESAFAMARKFFASPHEEKVQVKIGSNIRIIKRYLGREVILRRRFSHEYRAFNFGEFKNDKAQQPLPSSLVPHEAEISRFMNLCRKTCDRILTLLALGLGIPSDWFTTRHDSSKGPSGVTFRFLYYPSIQSPSTSTFQQNIDVRAGAHSDYGSITLLFQRDGQPGSNPNSNGGMGTCSHPTPAGVHDDKLPADSGQHRRLAQLLDERAVEVHRSSSLEQQSGSSHGDDRYSMAYFCHPLDDTELVPVPSKLVEQHRDAIAGDGPNADKIMTARDHLASRLAATYGGNPNEYK